MLDPYSTLGVNEEADDDTIRQAYLEQIRKYPPERYPQEFKATRQAYESIETHHKRLQHELFDIEQPTLTELTNLALPKGKSLRPDSDTLRQLVRHSLSSASISVPTVDN